MTQLSDMLVFLRKRQKLSQQELAGKTGISRSAISMYETGQREPDLETLEVFADFYNVDMNTLTGRADRLPAKNLQRMPEMHSVPRVGAIACGTPILAEENIETFDQVPAFVQCDFTLLCKGDSMVNARIYDGDIVCIRQQPEVENGEIAAVLVGEEATLKRVRFQEGSVILWPENPAYAPQVFSGEDMENVKILGKATHFISAVR